MTGFESEGGPAKERDRAPLRRPERKVVTTAELMEGAREIAIRHDDQEYRLQVTKNGKLILTK